MSVGDGTQNVFFFAKKQVLFFHFRFKNVEKQQQKDKHPKTDLRHLNRQEKRTLILSTYVTFN